MKNTIAKTDISIKQALKLLNKSGRKCLVIVNNNKKLIGTLSDGDIRKAIVLGVDINSKIIRIFQKKPSFLVYGEFTNQQAKKMFLKQKFDLIPVIDSKKNVVEILHWDEIFYNNKKNAIKKINIPVIIMAGGQGTRLQPFSEILPKPLIPINGKTILERIIEKFHIQGFQNFNFIINYKSLILKAYIQEIKEKFSINFFEEKKTLGTIGGILLAKNKILNNFFVSNCDVIINADYLDLLDFHKKKSNDITLVASTKEYIIPYGNCKIDKKGNLTKIIEKPKYDFLINSGLYVFNKRVMKLIPPNKYFDFTHLVEIAKKNKYKIGVYPIYEDSWIDVGQWSEYKKSFERF
jgi:dTDP-glucose pyrophosphorylase|tara:strand:- start:4680 stop:5729 length:1050 start_codon:yes stop_codon:yes gene_type:complete